MNAGSEKLFLVVFATFIGVITTASIVVAKGKSYRSNPVLFADEQEEISYDDYDDKVVLGKVAAFDEEENAKRWAQFVSIAVAAGVKEALKKPESSIKKFRQSLNSSVASAWNSAMNACGAASTYALESMDPEAEYIPLEWRQTLETASNKLRQTIETASKNVYGFSWDYVVDPVINEIKIPSLVRQVIVFTIIMTLFPGLSSWVTNEASKQLPGFGWWFAKRSVALGVQAVDGAMVASAENVGFAMSPSVAGWIAQAACALTWPVRWSLGL